MVMTRTRETPERPTSAAVIRNLDELLEPYPQEEFLSSVWGQSFEHIRGRRGRFARLLPWSELNRIIRQHRLDFPRLRLAHEGKTLPASACFRYVSNGRRKLPLPRLKFVELNERLREGATLVLDAVDELTEPLGELAAMLELRFHEHVQINSYAGWQTSRGFDLHWDDHDVFILQVTGRKRWSIYGMTRPYPLTNDSTTAVAPTHAPIWEETLEDGDLLYIPRGWWHVAQPLAEPTLHLTVGIHNRTGMDFARWLTERMRESAAFRQDLPRLSSPAARAAHMERLRQEFFDAWETGALESFYTELDALAEPRVEMSLPWSATTDAPAFAPETRVRLISPRPLEWREEAGVVEFACHKKRWRFAADALLVLRPLEERRVCTMAELCAAARARLDEPTVRALVRELLINGLVTIVDEKAP